jgi:hypothetical protein
LPNFDKRRGDSIELLAIEPVSGGLVALVRGTGSIFYTLLFDEELWQWFDLQERFVRSPRLPDKNGHYHGGWEMPKGWEESSGSSYGFVAVTVGTECRRAVKASNRPLQLLPNREALRRGTGCSVLWLMTARSTVRTATTVATVATVTTVTTVTTTIVRTTVASAVATMASAASMVAMIVLVAAHSAGFELF